MKMNPFVILEHREPGGHRHYDWLFALDSDPRDPDDRVLIHFRSQVVPDAVGVGESIDTEYGHRHRWRYLSYEGELADQRGNVRQVAAGGCAIDRLDTTAMGFTLELKSGLSRWEGRSLNGNLWRLQRLT